MGEWKGTGMTRGHSNGCTAESRTLSTASSLKASKENPIHSSWPLGSWRSTWKGFKSPCAPWDDMQVTRSWLRRGAQGWSGWVQNGELEHFTFSIWHG